MSEANGILAPVPGHVQPARRQRPPRPNDAYAQTLSNLAARGVPRRLWPVAPSPAQPVAPVAGHPAPSQPAEAVPAVAAHHPEPPADPQPDSADWVPFPVGVFPPCFRDQINAGSEAVGVEPAALVVFGLACAAAAIGGTRRLRIRSDWTAPSILWCSLLAESSAKKSPAMRAMLSPAFELAAALNRRNVGARAAYNAAEATWRSSRSRGTGRVPGAPPVQRPVQPVDRLFAITNFTTESLITDLQHNPRGLLYAPDELSHLFDSAGSYKQGAAGKRADTSFLLPLFNAEPVNVRRKTSGSVFCKAPHLSICGNIPPSVARRVFGGENSENGTLARFLPVAPPAWPTRWSDREIQPPIQRAYDLAVHRLHGLTRRQRDENGHWGPVELTLSPGALALLAAWTNENGKLVDAHQGAIRAYLGKLAAIPLRIAIILHELDRIANPGASAAAPRPEDRIVSEATMERAIVAARWWQHEGFRVYNVLAKTNDEVERDRLVDWIRQRGGRVRVRYVQSNYRPLRERGAALEALHELVADGFGRWHKEECGDGRTKKTFILKGGR